jgi:hypothetical protein
MKHLLTTAILLIAVAFTPTADAQSNIKIRLLFSEEAERGVIESAFRSALRRLGDIEILEAGERGEDYRLSVTTLCVGDCSTVRQYAVSYSLARPATGFLVYGAAMWAMSDSLLIARYAAAWDAHRDWMVRADSFITSYSVDLDAGLSLWGVNRYEQGVRELIARWDSKCFEIQRLNRRLVDAMSRDTVRARQIQGEMIGRKDRLC